MVKKILRQGLIVTPKQLKELAISLENEALELNPRLFHEDLENIKYQINIINKKPKESDTWEIEE